MEKWKSIPGYPGYMVSNIGQVRSHHRRVNGGWVISDEPRRVLKPALDRYKSVNLRVDGQTHHVRVAAMVLLAFVGPRPEGLEVCHENNDSHDNRLENLRYDTKLANHQDGVDPALVLKVCTEYASGKSGRAVAVEHGVSENKVNRWARGASYPMIVRPITNRGYTRSPIKLSDEQVGIIIERYNAGGVFMRELADEYGVSVSMVSYVVSGKRRALTT